MRMNYQYVKNVRLITLLCFLLFFVILVVSGCSNKKVLSFFFDGVTEEKVQADSLGSTFKIPENTLRIAELQKHREDSLKALNEFEMHSPYEEGECSSCHNVSMTKSFSSEGSSMSFVPAGDNNKGGWLILPIEELCIQCHDDKSNKYAEENDLNIHSPVADGECTLCHSPHRSKYKPLLLAERTRDLCFNCHDEDIPKGIDDHPELDETDDCIDCHNPHMSSEEYLLE